MRNRPPSAISSAAAGLAALILFSALYGLSRYNYLLYHSFIELFSVVIACSVFAVGWNTRHMAGDRVLFFLAVAYLSVGILDTVHTLAYTGMNVFPGRTSNLPTQLWIAARYVESLSLLAAALMLWYARQLPEKIVFLAYGAATAILLLLIVPLESFPAMYVEGSGLTAAKVASEYIICATLVAAACLFRLAPESGYNTGLLAGAIAVTIASELSFTLYTDVYGFFNFLGHAFKLVSFWLIYRALVSGLLKDPIGGLFADLARSREQLRRSEKQLRETNTKLNTIIRLNLDGMLVTDGQGEILFANPAAAEMLGRSEKELVGRAFGHPVTDQERAEIELLRPEGDSRIAEIRVTETYWDEKPAYLVSLRDVTERRRTEEALRQSEEKYRNILESMDEGYFEVDLRGNYTFYNDAMCRILGCPQEELEGTNYRKYMKDETAKEVFRVYNRVYQTGKPYKTFDWELVKRDGSPIYVDTSVSLVKDAQGRPVGFRGIVRDVSERKKGEEEKARLEAQLRHAQKMEAIGTLAGGIAHDFNNILSSVIGYTELSLDEVPAGSTLEQNLAQVLAAGKRARDLVKQILAISRKEEQDVQPTAVVPLIKEVLKMLRSTFPSSIEFRENICSQPLIVEADPTQIHQVIINLATNARQAMENETGVLEITVEPAYLDESIRQRHPDILPGNYVRISVSDTGIGISEQYLDKIFEPYFTTKQKGTGTGLGLSIVHGIVKNHKGTIEVESRLGAGTRFDVYLPLAAGKASRKPAETPETLPRGSEHILLVDDEKPIVEIQQTMLERLGYTVTPRTSSVEALAAVRANPQKFDLLLTDMTMPNMTGEKLAAAIKEIRPDIAVILCTGFSEKIDLLENQPHIDGVLMKPTGRAEMAKTVRAVLDGRV